MQILIGIILGIIISTVGFHSVADIGDKGVDKIKLMAKEAQK
jgi:hypothetical protein